MSKLPTTRRLPTPTVRVLHITDGAEWGGIEAHLLNLHRASLGKPIKVDFCFAFTKDAEPSRRFRAENAKVRVLDGRRSHYVILYERSPQTSYTSTDISARSLV